VECAAVSQCEMKVSAAFVVVGLKNNKLLALEQHVLPKKSCMQ
jgi:hypothetical protein